MGGRIQVATAFANDFFARFQKNLNLDVLILTIANTLDLWQQRYLREASILDRINILVSMLKTPLR